MVRSMYSDIVSFYYVDGAKRFLRAACGQGSKEVKAGPWRNEQILMHDVDGFVSNSFSSIDTYRGGRGGGVKRRRRRKKRRKKRRKERWKKVFWDEHLLSFLRQ